MTTAEQIEIAVQIVRKTDHAVCVTDGIQEVWLPLSQITMTPAMEDRQRTGLVIVTLPDWLAADKALL
ncbi:MAG: hypothetical protein ACOYLQ_09645 [Hyphomicrobiaceae bacterium]